MVVVTMIFFALEIKSVDYPNKFRTFPKEGV
jgi:hypothetical protein